MKIPFPHLFLAFLGMLILLPHCGKKAPPSLPSKAFPVRVEDLKGRVTNGSIVLTGRIPETAVPEEAFKGCRVYAAQYSLANPPCADCPIPYHGYRHFGAEALKGGALHCEMPAKKTGQIYFFEVRLVGPEDALGPPSDRIAVTMDEAAAGD